MISHDELLTTIDYNEETGIFTSKVDKQGHIRVGSVLGSLDKKTGYSHMQLNGKKYYLHRLAWFYVTGKWPNNKIDHKNGRRSDNWFDNLREATGSQNQGNRDISRNNTTGLKGVSKAKGRNRYRAAIWFNNKYIGLGSFVCPQEAATAYDKAAIHYYGEFALTNEMLRHDNTRRLNQ